MATAKIPTVRAPQQFAADRTLGLQLNAVDSADRLFDCRVGVRRSGVEKLAQSNGCTDYELAGRALFDMPHRFHFSNIDNAIRVDDHFFHQSHQVGSARQHDGITRIGR